MSKLLGLPPLSEKIKIKDKTDLTSSPLYTRKDALLLSFTWYAIYYTLEIIWPTSHYKQEKEQLKKKLTKIKHNIWQKEKEVTFI